MGTTLCRKCITLLLLISLKITDPAFLSKRKLSCSDMAAMMQPGSTVVRGRDWTWWEQKDVTPFTQGTVLGPYPGLEGHFIVKWESGRDDIYSMGYEDRCDLKVILQNTAPTVSSTHGTTPESTSTTVTTSRPGNSTSTTPVITRTTATTLQPENSTSTTPVITSTTVTTSRPGNSTSPPPSPTCHQCTCSKKTSESQAETDARAAELCNEASRLVVEAGKLSVETARVALQAAKSRAKVEEAELLIKLETMNFVLEAVKADAKTEEAKRLIELDTKKFALEAAKSVAKAEDAKAREALLVVETRQVYLEAAKSVAKAEESRATNEMEQLQFERARRSKTLGHL